MATRRRIWTPRVVPVPAGRASRTATTSPRGRALLDPRRGMLFPEGFGRFQGHRKGGSHNSFLDLFTAGDGAFVCVLHPRLKNRCILDSLDGLLQRDGDTAVHLFHPFSRDVADFPDIPHQLHELE